MLEKCCEGRLRSLEWIQGRKSWEQKSLQERDKGDKEFSWSSQDAFMNH